MAHIRPFTVRRFATRWLLAFFLLCATYNPSGYSYIDWITSNDGAFVSLKVTAGILLAGTYVAVWPIIYTSIGPVGIFTTLAWATTFSLVMWDYGVLKYVSPSFALYGIIATLATVVAVGMAFSHIQIQFWALKCLRKVAPKRY